MTSSFSHLSSAELTDRGLSRDKNEDALLRLPGRGFFCVADGMGGAQGGEVASRAIIDSLRRTFAASTSSHRTLADSKRFTARAINDASRAIKAFADERGFTGTGSTVVALAFDPADSAQATLLHAGDSRAYLYRAEQLKQLTADHSLAAALGVDDALLPDVYSGVITRAVGLADTARLDETATDVKSGDLFLLCTDGLTKMLSDSRLQALLAAHAAAALPDLARILVAAALAAGGHDNVTLILVRVHEPK